MSEWDTIARLDQIIDERDAQIAALTDRLRVLLTPMSGVALTKLQSRIVALLEKGPATHQAIAEAMYWDRHEDEWPLDLAGSISVRMTELRHKGFNIENIPNRGYKLIQPTTETKE